MPRSWKQCCERFPYAVWRNVCTVPLIARNLCRNPLLVCCPVCAGVLLCTDLAARGLDIPDVHWIVQFDPPQVRGEHRFASRGVWNCLCKGGCANIRFEQSLTTVWRPSWLVSLWAFQNVEQCWCITAPIPTRPHIWEYGPLGACSISIKYWFC